MNRSTFRRIGCGAAALAALTGLVACGGEAPAPGPSSSGAATSAGTPEGTADAATPTPSATSEAPSKLTLETLPATIGKYKVFADEGGFGYSTSGDASTPMISIMSIGSPADYAELKKNLGKAAEAVGENGFCDTSTTDPSCYFVTSTEAFFVSGQEPIDMAQVRDAAAKVAEIFA